MTLFELLTFLAVTALAGAGVGAGVGLITGEVATGARLGAYVGPVVAALGLTIYVSLRKPRDRRTNERAPGNDKKA